MFGKPDRVELTDPDKLKTFYKENFPGIFNRELIE